MTGVAEGGKMSASPFPHGKNGRASFVPCQQTRFAIHSHLYLWPCHRFDALFPFPVLRAAFCLAIERKIEGHFNVIANLCEIFLFPAVDPIENLVKSSFLPLFSDSICALLSIRVVKLHCVRAGVHFIYVCSYFPRFRANRF